MYLPDISSHQFLQRLGPKLRCANKTRPPKHALKAVCSSVPDVEVAVQRPKTKKQGSCYGCGARIQTEEPGSVGYVDSATFEAKAKHRQMEQLFCRRCQQLSNGEMVPAVADAWAKRQGVGGNRLPLVSPEELRGQLTQIREKAALVVLLVDLLDASGSFLGRLRDLTGRNPIVLVGTKVDLLPKGAVLEDVRRWLESMALAKQLNVIHTCLVSSRTKGGIGAAGAYLRKNRLGRDVYIVGAANVGKSAFSRALVNDMSDMTSTQFDPAAAAAARRLPVQSAMPGTTIQIIPLQAFHSGGHLLDTPGVHLHHRVPHMLTPEEAGELHPKRKLKAFVAPRPADVTLPPPTVTAGQKQSYSATYLWGGLARIDVASSSPTCNVTFYGIPQMRVSAAGLQKGEAGLGLPDTETAFGASSVAATGGLRVAREAMLRAQWEASDIGDLAVSGVPGWAAISAGEHAEVQVRVWAPIGIEAYVRPPLPCPNPALLDPECDN